ncbi:MULTISPECIES: FHA domain-containing protein [Calothrix]|uniref:FHA domain-containing protein n=2 Tax=Calothrix TaxID=1186 RepID=A0ABR8ANJ3_9CYAN|nr:MULTISPECIES: FHA domain-containing protein [Calothrix]MBD2200197.1 FHA domain-containing protein [Calothrix parietina FACHB-288]MBD2229148.1 FHA domain-containing protein [Calothrix anomala FACHB-343]
MKVISAKTDKLAKSIHAVRQFVSERGSQDEAYLPIGSALATLEKALQTKSLVVQIISQDVNQAQSLQKLLNMNSLVREAYQIQTSPLPEISQLHVLPAVLTLKCDHLNGKQSFRYKLTSTKPQIIGRNPDIAQILLPDELSLVSGCHLEIQPLMKDGWQVRDVGSRNGTYINGSVQKLPDWYQLKAGDEICLGSVSGATGSATLVFESSGDRAAAKDDTSQLFNCDVLCLITDLSQPLSNAAKQLMAQASEGKIAKLFIIATTPGIGNPEVIQAHWRTMEAWVKSQPYYPLIEQIALALQPVIANPQATVLFPHTRPEFEQFSQTLETLAKEKAEEMLLQRIMTQLVKLVDAIEAILKQQEAKLKQETHQAEDQLNSLAPATLKEQTKKAIKKVEGEKEQFRQIKTAISQSEAHLLDKFRQNALPQKVEHFVKHLEPAVFDQGGHRTVRLQLGNEQNPALNDMHTAALSLAQAELAEWATTQWKHICLSYGEGGLNGLWQRSYKTLNCIPEVALPSSTFEVTQSINIQPVLQISAVAPTECKVRYKQPGLLGYLGKNFKGQMISTVSTLMLVGSTFIPKEWNIKKFLIPGLIPPIGVAVFFAYQHERAMKVEEAVEKLQKGTLSYYQSLSEDLTKKLSQYLSSSVDSEERRFWTTLETVSEQYTTHISELEMLQLQLKAQIENSKKLHLKNLEQSLADLEKLKREILAIAPTMTKA